jgi:TetR/AcrR family transcriptional regulator, cholesterol catabolism regulator
VAKEGDKTWVGADKVTTGGRIRSWVSNGARREQEVLDAASKVFYALGYADASVQDVADELGLLKGSLYHYIDSKDDLLFRLLDETQQEVQAILDENAALEGAGPLERLRQYVIRLVAYMTQNVANMTIYFHDMDQLSERRRTDLYRRQGQHRRYVMGLIEQAQEQGEVDASIDAKLTVNFMLGSMIWAHHWFPAGRFTAAEVSSGAADFVMSSLARRG